jgi:hypothetical protein
MKKIIFLLIITASILNAQDYNIYSEKLMSNYQNGTSINNLRYIPVPDPMSTNGPSAFDFDQYGNLFILDSHNFKVKKLINFKIISEIQLSSDYGYNDAYLFEVKNDGFLFSEAPYTAFKTDENNKILVHAGSNFPILKQKTDYSLFIEHNNYIFQYLNDGGIVCFYSDKGVTKMLENEAVHNMFKPGSGFDMKGLTIDSKNRLFLNGELQTRDYGTYIRYQKEKDANYSLNKKHKYMVFSAEQSQVSLIGKDKAGNIYWNVMNNDLIIFNSSGFVIEKLKYNQNKSKTLPAVHPSGDIYFLDYDEKEVRLYSVQNVWDPEGRKQWFSNPPKQDMPVVSKAETKVIKYGILNDNQVRMRETPDLNGKTVGYLQKNDRVEILEATKEKMKVGTMESVWYKVKTATGMTGWAYGYFVDME